MKLVINFTNSLVAYKLEGINDYCKTTKKVLFKKKNVQYHKVNNG